MFVQQSARTGLLLILVAALTLAATSLIQSYFTQKGLQEEASRRAESHRLKFASPIRVRASTWA